MKKINLCFFFLIAGIVAQSQTSIGLSGGVFQLHSPATNNTVNVFNFTRIWLDKKLERPSNGLGGQLVVNRKLNHWLDFTSVLGYQFFESTIENSVFSMKAEMEVAQLMLGVRFRPFSFNEIDSAGLKYEPFIGVFFGAFGNSATVFQNNQAVIVDNKSYRSLNANFAAQLSLGYLFQISKRCVIAPQYQLSFLPNMQWTNFDLALHGTSVPNLYNKSNNWLNAFQISITWKINKALPSDDVVE